MGKPMRIQGRHLEHNACGDGFPGYVWGIPNKALLQIRNRRPDKWLKISRPSNGQDLSESKEAPCYKRCHPDPLCCEES